MRKTALRTERTHNNYVVSEKDPDFMTNAPAIKEYEHWRIIPNTFPYDVIAEVHHMLVLKRREPDLLYLYSDEKDELRFIMRQLEYEERYDSITLNFKKNQSQPGWLHFHLIKLKEL